MIAFVTGKLAEKKPAHVLVDVGGIGYFIAIPASTYESLPKVGEAVTLQTAFIVREDNQALYGFASAAEKTVFQTMLAVSGVGPKLALAALSAMSPMELRDRVVDGDTTMLVKIPGVGRKTAERMVVELSDRFAKLDVFSGASPLSGGTDARAAARADALAALEALGLARAAAERALRKTLRNHPGSQSADELVRLALRES